jgi:hypothetical protein
MLLGVGIALTVILISTQSQSQQNGSPTKPNEKPAMPKASLRDMLPEVISMAHAFIDTAMDPDQTADAIHAFQVVQHNLKREGLHDPANLNPVLSVGISEMLAGMAINMQRGGALTSGLTAQAMAANAINLLPTHLAADNHALIAKERVLSFLKMCGELKNAIGE